LLTASQRSPDVNFVGVEIERKYALFTATRLAKRNLRNVRLVWGDARIFFRDCVAAESLRAVHLYFPDPWWKNRHRKRRVVTDEFVRECVRALRPGGRLYVVTDVAEYFAHITELMGRETRLAPLPPPAVQEPRHDGDYLTNFERKYQKEGRTIHRASYEKL
jgi:tRNA (guanine-N7-)-methyltransferase